LFNVPYQYKIVLRINKPDSTSRSYTSLTIPVLEASFDMASNLRRKWYRCDGL